MIKIKPELPDDLDIPRDEHGDAVLHLVWERDEAMNADVVVFESFSGGPCQPVRFQIEVHRMDAYKRAVFFARGSMEALLLFQTEHRDYKYVVEQWLRAFAQSIMTAIPHVLYATKCPDKSYLIVAVDPDGSVPMFAYEDKAKGMTLEYYQGKWNRPVQRMPRVEAIERAHLWNERNLQK